MLDVGLTTYISAFFGASKIGQILHFLYVGFLIGALILGLFVATTVIYTVPENANNLLNGLELNALLKASKLNLNMSKLDNALHQSIVNRSPTLSVEGQFLFSFLWAGFFSTLAGVIII